MAEQMADKKQPDPAEADEGATSPPVKRAKSRLPLIVVAAVVVGLIAGGAGAYFAGLLDPFLGGGETAAKDGHDQAAAPVTSYFSLPDLMVSLNTGRSRPIFLKLRVTLEIPAETTAARIQEAMPRIVDYSQTYLRELRPEELHGSAGSVRLREELLRRIQAAVAPSPINDVLFSELLMQ